MSYTGAQIVAAFLDANETAGWAARSYSTESLDQVHFTTPSKLVKVTYDCKEGVFLIGFEKLLAGWNDYVRAIARTVHYILKTLQAGGLDFLPPDSAEGVQITVSQARNGLTYVRAI